MPRYAFIIDSKSGKELEFHEFLTDKAAEDYARKAGNGTTVTIHSNQVQIATVRNP